MNDGITYVPTTAPIQRRVLYVFTINDDDHKDCIKVGETIVKDGETFQEAAKRRIKVYTGTAGIKPIILWTEDLGTYRDHDVHNVLKRSGYPSKDFGTNSREWFCCDLDTVKKAFEAVRNKQFAIDKVSTKSSEPLITFREEQRRAITGTVTQFLAGGKKYLWDAKMRFGKTCTALEVVREMQSHRTLIITHRPSVVQEWATEFKNIFVGNTPWRFGSKSIGHTFTELEGDAQTDENRHYIYFVSMQYSRGDELISGLHKHEDNLFAVDWDMIIVDEAHEGTQTRLGEAVLKELIHEHTKVLSLSGTPYNLTRQYEQEEIFTWTYLDEQRAKLAHLNDEYNPYFNLPRLNLYTFSIDNLGGDYIDKDEVYFNFHEFFRVEENHFVHEKDVQNFLQRLTHEKTYPFGTEERRKMFRHTLWMLPGVEACKAMESLLQEYINFTIINVAGNSGDECKDAAERVRKAQGTHPEETYTITLSCRRLSTGVTIRPWTAVLMLSGSENTDAKAYMQTIFRVQSPWEYDHTYKTDCYAFDFAPQRALMMLHSVINAQHNGDDGSLGTDTRNLVTQWLQFMPVVACQEAHMIQYDTNELLRTIKRVRIERAVQKGFDDKTVYNSAILFSKLSQAQITKLNDLATTIGSTSASKKPKDVIIAENGLSEKEKKEAEDITKKPVKERTAAEKKRLKELEAKRKQEETRVAILRGISIRIPLLAYGAVLRDKELLTIDNFPEKVDDASWEEFMPKGVTKEVYNDCKEFYDKDILEGAMQRIRSMADEAERKDILGRIEDITMLLACFRNPDKETVLTPWRVVNMHLSKTIGGWCFYDEKFEKNLYEPRYVTIKGVTDKIFQRGYSSPAKQGSLLEPPSTSEMQSCFQSTRVLEINSKTGLYPLYLAYTFYEMRREKRHLSIAEQKTLWQEVVKRHIFVLCKTPMAKAITERTLGVKTSNIRYIPDIIHRIQNDQENLINDIKDPKGWGLSNTNTPMNFNLATGNPPYQIEGIEINRNQPVYNYYFDVAFKLVPIVAFISPARFLAQAGQTPKEWNMKMLNDTHFKVVHYEASSKKIFDTADIKGGIAMTIWDSMIKYTPIKVFTAFSEQKQILYKVQQVEGKEYVGLNTIISPKAPYRFSDTFFEENPNHQDFFDNGAGAQISSIRLEAYPDIFLPEEPIMSNDYYKIWGLCNQERVVRWIKKDYVEGNKYISTYNVFVPAANGSGAIGEILSTPMIGQPMIGHTNTFLSIGQFQTEYEANGCLKYVKTKFARLMLGILKLTQNNPRETWTYVPLQDFTPKSDIDWSRSVKEIDQQLYKKYGLSAEEIAFIESNVREMQ